MSTEAADEYDVPLRDQRYFGAGIKRKRIHFVQSTSTPESTSNLPATPSTTVADRYLELVLKEKVVDSAVQDGTTDPNRTEPIVNGEDEQARDMECVICHRAISTGDTTTSHDSSIVHQICLQHSHPPSSIDRSRKGLAVLQGLGWDPDSRKGLGAEGRGILHPVKARDNPARAGLGVQAEATRKVEKPAKLDAGKMRLKDKEAKKKAARLQEAFFRSEDVLRYLGE